MPPALARLVRAGEVVGGPASAVKELCENSLDAGAMQITVTISSDTVSCITVEDNGAGMTPEDMGLCMLVHATSKTYNARELENPLYFGFRGEALSALAACACVSLRSRRIGYDCHLIESRNGVIGEVVPCSGLPGTCITVENLFRGLPARLAMLRSRAAEAADIRKTIEHLSLSRPDVCFVLLRENRQLLRLEPGSLTERINALSDDPGIDVFAERDGWTLEGRLYVGVPSKPESRLVVNGRPVLRDSAFAQALKKVAAALARGRHHAFRGRLVTPPDVVSYNVHAAKEEIKYVSPDFARDFIVRSLTETVREVRGRGYSHEWEGVGFTPAAPEAGTGVLGKVIGIAGDNYIISLTESGLVLTDAHAGHERVLLEELRSTAAPAHPVILSAPLIVPVPPGGEEKLETCLDMLHSVGFETDSMGDGYLIVRAVPAVFGGIITPISFRSLLDVCEKGEDILIRKIADIACRAAFRTGDGLTHEKADAILRDMEKTPGSGFCNHGRPTSVKMGMKAMATVFGR